MTCRARGTTGPHRYTKAIIEKQAAKGRDFSCEALYLDPGWDTTSARSSGARNGLARENSSSTKCRPNMG